MQTKECFGDKCLGCAEFFSCEEHWGNGGQWNEDEDGSDE